MGFYQGGIVYKYVVKSYIDFGSKTLTSCHIFVYTSNSWIGEIKFNYIAVI